MKNELTYQKICTDILHCETQKHILDLEIEKNLLVLNNLVRTKLHRNGNNVEEIKFKLSSIIKRVDNYLKQNELIKSNT